MENKEVKDCKFSKASHAIKMDDKNSIKIDDESINVDPELPFMRLV